MIQLHWLRKVLRRLKRRQNNNVRYSSAQRYQNSRSNTEFYSGDLEARVYYEYPKGKFRFPVIPDQPPGGKKKPHSERPAGQKVSKIQSSGGQKGRTESSSVNKLRTEPEQIKNKPYGNRRPFKRTEVPSPVYGFDRPRNHPANELKSGPVKDTEEKNQSSSSIPVEFVNESLHDAARQEYRQDDILHTEQPGALFEDETATKGCSFDEKESGYTEGVNHTNTHEQVESEKRPASELQTFTKEKEMWTFDALEQKIINEEPEEEEAAGSAAVSVSPPVDEAPVSENFAGDMSLENIFTSGKEDGGTAEGGETDVREFPSVTGPFPEKSPSVSERKASGKENGKVTLNKEHTLKGREQNKNEKGSSSPSIPFNVVMLKSDKQKLAERLRAEKIFSGSPGGVFRSAGEVSAALSNQEQDKQTRNTAGNRISGIVHSVSKKKEYCAGRQKAGEGGSSHKKERSGEESTRGELPYMFPPVALLKPPVKEKINIEWMENQKRILDETLKNFNVRAKVVNMTQGPSVTRFEVHPEPGVKVNKITNLSDDIKLSLAAKDIRIEAPIPGKHTIGIEVPNKTRRPVFISELINNPVFMEHPSPLAAVLGLDISGRPVVTDLKKMPHGLIAGATGSGKSVCINSILVSLLYKANPADVKLLLIDPKMVELAPYNQIPHLVSPVITDVKAATAALKWAVVEMEHRYELFARTGVRDISRYNALVVKENRFSDKLPYIVVIIDELADLMMMSPADVEEAICRIAQKARACGIHLIIATQRPSVDVITGLIKANVPTRIAFSVSSQVDSRTIIDIAGAERLLGKGDMLFLENGVQKPVRLQGTFVTDEEIDAVVAHVRREQSPEYLFEQEELLKQEIAHEEDELFYDACEFIIQNGGASTSSLQRRFKIGYNRAARLIDMMEAQGIISGAKGSKPRDVLITELDLEAMKNSEGNF